MGVDPLTIGLAIASAASSVAGSVAQGKQADYRADVAKQNAGVARWNAAQAERAGAAKLETEMRKWRGVIGQQIAGQGASGLQVGSGSAAAVNASASALAGITAGNIVDNTAREAHGYRAQETAALNEAALAKASKPSAFSTILGAASAAAGTYTGLGGKLPSFGGAGGSGGAAAALGGSKAGGVGAILQGANSFGRFKDPEVDWTGTGYF